jgi:hypothetical protein
MNKIMLTSILLLAVSSFIFAGGKGDGNYDSMNIGDVTKIVVTMSSEDLSVSDGYITWSPKTDVKKATYEKIHFKRANFEKKVGSIDEVQGSVCVKIKIERMEDQVYIPDDSMASYPDGGFQNKIFEADIIKQCKPDRCSK